MLVTAVDVDISPPADFGVYGLDWSWRGVRWLDFFEARHGEPAWALWLGHRAADDSGVRVGTLPKQRHDDVLCPRGGDPFVEVALSAAFGLVNLTLPDSSVARPDGLIPALVRHAEEQAKLHRNWRRAMWHIDGSPAEAAVWTFAGAWAGFSATLADAYLVAVGIGTEPDELRLVQVTDGEPYGADLNAPLSHAELSRQRHERPDTWLPSPHHEAFHPDQLAHLP